MVIHSCFIVSVLCLYNYHSLGDTMLPKTCPILTGICYRPHRQYNLFLFLELPFNEGNYFSNTLSSLLGDFNTNILVPSITMFLLMLFIILNVNFCSK